MDLEILGLSRAQEYKPRNPTYAIRIKSGAFADFDDSKILPLQESDLYTIVKYIFDDIDPGYIPPSRNPVMINEDIAGKILEDFRREGLDKDTLLVHCSMGKNRSPAVGIALNEIYNLGHDTGKLKRKFPELNLYVYKMLLKVAKS